MSEFVVQNRMPGGKIIAVSDCDSDNLGGVVTFPDEAAAEHAAEGGPILAALAAG